MFMVIAVLGYMTAWMELSANQGHLRSLNVLIMLGAVAPGLITGLSMLGLALCAALGLVFWQLGLYIGRCASNAADRRS